MSSANIPRDPVTAGVTDASSGLPQVACVRIFPAEDLTTSSHSVHSDLRPHHQAAVVGDHEVVVVCVLHRDAAASPICAGLREMHVDVPLQVRTPLARVIWEDEQASRERAMVICGLLILKFSRELLQARHCTPCAWVP